MEPLWSSKISPGWLSAISLIKKKKFEMNALIDNIMVGNKPVFRWYLFLSNHGITNCIHKRVLESPVK